jgi:hypothetical protein
LPIATLILGQWDDAVPLWQDLEYIKLVTRHLLERYMHTNGLMACGDSDPPAIKPMLASWT